MHRDRLYQLANLSNDPAHLGSKLRQGLLREQGENRAENYSQIKEWVSRVGALTQTIEEYRKEYLRVARPDRERDINAQVGKAVSESQALLPRIEEKLKEINSEYQAEKQRGDETHCIACLQTTRRANTTIGEFRSAQERFATAVRDTLKRQTNVLQGGATEEEIDRLVAEPERFQQMMKAKLLDTPSIQLESAVSDIVDKCRDIVRLQKSMHECMDLTRELALLVNMQGEQLNTIEDALTTARDHVDNGEVKLIEAKVLHKKSRKKICCIIMLVLALIGAIIIPVLITQL